VTAKKARSMKGAPAKVPTSLVKIGRDGEQLKIGARTWELVYDQELNLYWPAKTTAVDVTHGQAMAAAKAFTNDWLKAQGLKADAPTRRQLLSLVDDTRYDPAIDVRFFPKCESRYFWTKTPYAPLPGYSWLVYFYGGLAYGNHHDNLFCVRAVCAGQ
jgi:hypothetical protein